MRIKIPYLGYSLTSKIEKLPTGTWSATVTVDGIKRTWFAIGLSQNEASERAIAAAKRTLGKKKRGE